MDLGIVCLRVLHTMFTYDKTVVAVMDKGVSVRKIGKKMLLILGAKHRFSFWIPVAYQFDEDKHRYICRKVSELDFHPSLRLGEVCEKIQLSNNHIPCLPTTVLLSYFHLSSSPMIQQLRFRVLLSRSGTALIPTINRKLLPLRH